MPVQDVGGLAERQSEVAPVERDVVESDGWTTGLLLRGEPGRIRRETGERHAPLDAALHVDELDLDVHGVAQFGMVGLQLTKFDDFTGLGTAGAQRTL